MCILRVGKGEGWGLFKVDRRQSVAPNNIQQHPKLPVHRVLTSMR